MTDQGVDTGHQVHPEAGFSESPAWLGTGTYVSDVIVDVLVERGCRYAALTPGASFRGLHDSLVARGAHGDMELLLFLHEEGAVAAAHGYAKATGTVGLAVVHNLVGLMHASMAVYNAWRDRAPVLLLGGSGPRKESDRRPIDWIHVAADQGQLVRDFVKWRSEPADAAGMIAAIVRGHQIAATPPCGPVYISLDSVVQEDLAPAGLVSAARPRFAPPSASPADPRALGEAAALLADARRPVILAGSGSRDAQYSALLERLAELLGAPCVDGWNSAAFPTTSIFSADSSVLDTADVLLRVDMSDADAALAGLRAATGHDGPAPTRIIDLGWGGTHGSGAYADGPLIPAHIRLAADPSTGLAQLLEAVPPRIARAGGDWEGSRRRRVEDARVRKTEAAEQQELVLRERWADRPISPHRLVSELWNAVRGRPWRLVLRNDRSWPSGIWEFTHAGQYLGGSGGGGIGYGPGAMVGAALAARDAQQLPVAIVGDGDLLMCPTALWTAVAHGIPLLVVANNNQSLYNDEAHQLAVARHRGRPAQNSRIGTRIDSPVIDLASMARSFGAWVCDTVRDPEHLSTALAAAVAAVDEGRVAFVDVTTASR